MSTPLSPLTTNRTIRREPYMKPIAAWVIGCPRPGCAFSASAMSEGRAIRELANHLVHVHTQEQNDGRQ